MPLIKIFMNKRTRIKTSMNIKQAQLNYKKMCEYKNMHK